METHLHTALNSSCAKVSPEDVVRIYWDNGYDALTVTNHWNRKIAWKYFGGERREIIEKYLGGYERVKELADGSMRVFFGMELALREDYYSPFNFGAAEILVYGITPAQFKEYAFDLIEFGYPELKEFSAKRGWLLFQAHPYRERTRRIDVRYLDGLETYNNNPRHSNRNFLARARRKKYDLLMVGGSDFHQPEDVGAGVILDKEIGNETELADALRSRELKILKPR